MSIIENKTLLDNNPEILPTLSALPSVYGYIRVSTETQVKKGYGLETQRNAIVDYCKNNNLNLIKIYEDKGISGAVSDSEDITKREHLIEMLSSLENNNDIKTVVVLNTSRLWRNDGSRIIISRDMKRCNSDIISIEQSKFSLYVTDPTEKFFNSLMTAFDQYERDTVVLKLAKGRTTKANKGYKPAGRLPFGYKSKYNELTQKKDVVVNHQEAKLIQEIFELYAKNRHIPNIVKQFNTRKIFTQKGNEWTQATLTKMLNNKFYIGILTHAGKEIQGKHEAIISQELWDKTHNTQ